MKQTSGNPYYETFHQINELGVQLAYHTAPGGYHPLHWHEEIELLYQLNRQMEIPKRFEKFPASAIEEVIDMAFQECHGGYPVPRYFTWEHARKLMEAVCAKEDA